MTKSKDLKRLIRARMKKAGEKYAEARRQILSSSDKLCPACNTRLMVRNVREMMPLDDDMTEGQMADWFAAEETGDWGDWEYQIEETYCPRCESEVRGALRSLFTLDRRLK